MNQVEFDAIVKDGVIEIPAQFAVQIAGQVHVTVSTADESVRSPSLIQQLLSQPLDLPGLKPMSRDEIYGR